MKILKVSSDFSGIGAFDQALKRLRVPHLHLSACEMDRYARQSYIRNYGTVNDIRLLDHPDVKFCDEIYRKYADKKLKRPTISQYKKLLSIQEETARLFSFYYPWNVKYRKEEPGIDIYMTSPPCQSFSFAGKRLGEGDAKGILFYNSHAYIQKAKPRYFIFENVKGLLSDAGGETFRKWVSLLGGKSVNGATVDQPHPDSVPYHVHYKVLNAKHYEVPQNRERVFIVGVRDDSDNNFSWPEPFPLVTCLGDVLETGVDPKYFLSDVRLEGSLKETEKHKAKGSGFKFEVNNSDTAKAITTAPGSRITDNYIRIGRMIGRNPDNPSERRAGMPTRQTLEINKNGTSNALTTVQKDNVVVSSTGIRRLTPRECLRLMDFPESFKIVVSDSQAYKQAGNSIVVNKLYWILKNLNL